jgi:transcriptional regulator with XRE-family HTH domain
MTTFFRRRREELKLTQRDIALKLNITTGAVSSWDMGDAFPRPPLWDAVAEVLQVPVETLAAEILSAIRAQQKQQAISA